MDITTRENAFSETIRAQLPKPDHVSPCYGTSNIARMVPGGIVLGVSNLANFAPGPTSLGLLSRLCPLPNAELYVAAVIHSEITKLHDRHREMLTIHMAGD